MRSKFLRDPHAESPINVEFAVGGLTIGWPDLPLEQEQGLFGPKPQVVGAFVRANALEALTAEINGAASRAD